MRRWWIRPSVSGAVIRPMTFLAGTLAAGFVGAGLGAGMVRIARRSNPGKDSALQLDDPREAEAIRYAREGEAEALGRR